MGPEGLGTAHDRTQVLGIGQTIDGDEERRFTGGTAAIDQARQIKGLGRRGLQHDALMHRAAADLAEPRPGDLLHQDPARLGFAQQLQEARAEAHLRRAPDAMDRTAALQGRLCGVPPPDQIAGGGPGEVVTLRRLAGTACAADRAAALQANELSGRTGTGPTGQETGSPGGLRRPRP